MQRRGASVLPFVIPYSVADCPYKKDGGKMHSTIPLQPCHKCSVFTTAAVLQSLRILFTSSTPRPFLWLLDIFHSRPGERGQIDVYQTCHLTLCSVPAQRMWAHFSGQWCKPVKSLQGDAVGWPWSYVHTKCELNIYAVQSCDSCRIEIVLYCLIFWGGSHLSTRVKRTKY